MESVSLLPRFDLDQAGLMRPAQNSAAILPDSANAQLRRNPRCVTTA
jgi:hypothetical protein